MSRFEPLKNHLQTITSEALKAGTYKIERVITSPQGAHINSMNKNVLNFCANNYLGLSNDKEVLNAAKAAIDKYGFGLSSVRFICGTQDIHKVLEQKIAKFHQKEDAILYSSCFDANAGIFEAITNEQDTILSDSLNHASIIDGMRLCKAKKVRYEHLNMQDLEKQLQESMSSRVRLIVTDGIFSMDGDIAPLDKIVALAKKYKAVIFIDECHATGFIGKTGKGTPELFGVENEIDIINSTLGKALGGASGGYTTAKKEVIEVLRQKSRPYLFSNTLCPSIVGASIKVFDMLEQSTDLSQKLIENTRLFRQKMKKRGFKILGHDECPIAPVYLGDAKLAAEFAEEMMNENIYVIGFSFPVVPKDKARIRVQLSAAHSKADIEMAIEAFTKVGLKKGVIEPISSLQFSMKGAFEKQLKTKQSPKFWFFKVLNQLN